MFQPAGAHRRSSRRMGAGLNPLLRHPGMIIHPPMLYLGFVSFVIPFAFAIAALVTGRTDDRWIRITRRWTLVAWLFLSLGLVLGRRWAYDVLGWGGYWGWDPVEIAAFMPWLTRHGLPALGHDPGKARHVQALEHDPDHPDLFAGHLRHLPDPLGRAFLGACLCAERHWPAVLRLYRHHLHRSRWRCCSTAGTTCASEGQMTSLLSRESLFLLNNLLFMGILVVCFWGVIFPLISELFTGQKVTVGPPFYERATGPLFAGLLLLDGHRAAFGLGTFHLQDAGPGHLETGCWSRWWCWWWSIVTGHALVGRAAGLLAVRPLSLRSPCMNTGAAVWARHRRTGESLPVALWRLAGRNRRRYGGYIIHLGVVLMALGIIGIEMFQTETQGTIAAGRER